MIIKKIHCLAICLFLSSIMMGYANAALISASMNEGGAVEAPWGFIDFCNRNPGECVSLVEKAQIVSLTPKRIAELSVVQMLVNKQIIYATDSSNYGKGEYWTFPDGSGDCEDYALEKRRRLISMGWPRSALLLTAARMENGQKHMVLMVVTNKGDFVLDNRRGGPRHWKALEYRWLARQSRFNESGWVALSPFGEAFPGASKIFSAP